MLGSIEAGGTKFVCAVSDNNFSILDKTTIPTTNPKDTFKNVFNFFDQYEMKAIGIGSFGPIDVNLNSHMYGFVTSTPKKQWQNTDFVSVFKDRYNIPIGWNTDVNIAALGEFTMGSAKNKNSCVYITVGTGIGGGAVVKGELLSGYSHPEMGHFYIPRHPRDNFEGICSYHENCLEGLASGPAIEKRVDMKAELLPKDHELWEIESYYLAQAAMAYTTILSPECIIFGGGVMNQSHLFDKIRINFEKLLKGYLNLPPLDQYIIPTGLGNDSGIIGGLTLAESLTNKS